MPLTQVKPFRGLKLVVIATAQLHSTKPELRFCAGSSPARGVSEIRDGEDLWQWSRLEIRLRLSSVNHTTKTIHHHHHHRFMHGFWKKKKCILYFINYHISLSRLYFLRYWVIVYCKCLLSSLWHHKFWN